MSTPRWTGFGPWMSGDARIHRAGYPLTRVPGPKTQLHGWPADREARAGRAAGDAQRAAIARQDRPHDRQPQPAALVGAGATASVEALAQALKLVIGDARAT